MKKTNLTIAIIITGIATAQLLADDQWADVEIVPNAPSTSDIVAITLSGVWGNSCIPNDSAISVSGNDIYFDAIWDYPPDIVCLNVMTPWELTEYVGPLPQGTYNLYARIVGHPYTPETYELMTEFVVTDYQFVLSTESLSVDEGGTASFTVAVLNKPLGTVQVSVANESGDPDITLLSGESLDFTPANYSIPQMVTVAAAEDPDILDGTAVIRIKASGYLTAEVYVTEIDNDVPTIIYVDDDASAGLKTGTSWENAFTNLQEALSAATTVPEIQEIRVAQGVYKPAEPSGDRNATFMLINGVTLKGGYAGLAQPNPNIRNIDAYPTVLSGDLNGDDVGDLSDPSRNDNSYKVVKGDSSVNKSAILDGFTITAANCESSGGGIFISYGIGPIIANCNICANQAYFGGGIFNQASSKIINCIFSRNSANSGGGFYGYGGSPTLINCTFGHNSANDDGGGVYIPLQGTTVTNCIFWENNDSGSTDESAQIYSETSLISYCCVQSWSGSLGGDGNIDTDPCFADPCNGDYHLQSTTGRWDPVMLTWVEDETTSNCIDAGNPGFSPDNEPFPHGNRINMGAYGGTIRASKSPENCDRLADLTNDYLVDFNDLAVFVHYWLLAGQFIPGDLDRSSNVDLMDFALLAQNWPEICDGNDISPPDCLPDDLSEYSLWVSLGKPECWCYPRQCYGDVDGLADFSGLFYVGPTDLAIFISCYENPLYYPCVDFNRDGQIDAMDAAIIETWMYVIDVPTDCGGMLNP